MDTDETPASAICREFLEEFALTVMVNAKVPIEIALSPHKGLLFYLLRCDQHPVLTGHSHDQIAWITPESPLPGQLLPADAQALPTIWDFITLDN